MDKIDLSVDDFKKRTDKLKTFQNLVNKKVKKQKEYKVMFITTLHTLYTSIKLVKRH